MKLKRLFLNQDEAYALSNLNVNNQCHDFNNEK